MSNWLKWEARDPAEVIERKEAGLCKGCAREIKVVILGDPRAVCNIGKKHSDHGGKRCAKYIERGNQCQ